MATPAAARKRTDHVNDETRTILGVLDENVVTPKRKRRRKAGKKSKSRKPTSTNWRNINVCSPRQTNT